MPSPKSENVSPTAYATGWLWVRHGLSPPALGLPEGRKLDRGFRALIAGIRLTSGISLDAMMLARHRGIDAILQRAIDQKRVGQVIELAAGLSGRGWRFTRNNPGLTYLETDLPAMAATKRRLLESNGLMGARHRVVELDVLRDDGAASLAAVAATLDPTAGTAIITEGLMNYLAPDDAEAVWRRIAGTLGRFPHGLYLADVYPRKRKDYGAAMTAFGAVLSAFVRGRMHQHFASPEEVLSRMRGCGFGDVTVHSTDAIREIAELGRTPGADRVRVLEAWT